MGNAFRSGEIEMENEKKYDFKTLAELWLVFFKIGTVTFGGGMAMLPILDRELVVKRNWTTSEELLDYFTLSQSLPGLIAANVSIFLGYRRAGKIGGIVAPLATITPSVIVITIIAACLENFSSIPIIQKALSGINVGVAAMLTYTVVNFGKKTVKDFFGILLAASAFVMLFFFKVNTLWIILFGTLAGIVYTCCRGGWKELMR